MPGLNQTAAVTGRCAVCGSTRLQRLHRSRSTSASVRRCEVCRLVFILDPPADADLVRLYGSADDHDRYLASQRTEGLRQRHLQVLGRLHAMLPSAGQRRPRLFDVGAGSGDFLALARTGGFDVAGNEISVPAIETSRARYAIDLHHGDMRGLQLDGQFDAVTMWCVLAHVADAGGLLSDAFGLLRPGGVLYLHTPRWCAIDRVGLAVARVTGGRCPQLIDRRINPAHLCLYNTANLRATLTGAGFESAAVRPMAGYSLNTRAYLASMRVPAMAAGPAATAFDWLIGRGWAPRNILDAYARKPAG